MNSIIPKAASQQDLEKIVLSQVEKLTVKARKLLGRVVWSCANLPIVYFSQSYLANKDGYSREHVNRLIRDFVELGLISTTDRPGRTLLYHITDLITDPRISWLLRHILPSVKGLFLPDLLSRRSNTDQVTRYIKDLVKRASRYTLNEINEPEYKKWSHFQEQYWQKEVASIENAQENSALLSFEEFCSVICS